MLSIFLQITGNVLLVYAIISQKFSEMITDSTFSLSDKSKRKRIEGKLATKWEIFFGFIYVIIGLIISLPELATIISSVSFFNNYFINIGLMIILLIVAFGFVKLILFANKEKIDVAVNNKVEGEMWIE